MFSLKRLASIYCIAFGQTCQTYYEYTTFILFHLNFDMYVLHMVLERPRNWT